MLTETGTQQKMLTSKEIWDMTSQVGVPRTLEIEILSENLLNEVTKDCWLDCLDPLEYFLLPLGITNLCKDKKHSILIHVWSWIYLMSLPFGSLIYLNQQINVYIQTDIAYMRNLLYLIFSDYVITVVVINAFIRFYFLRKRYLQQLVQSLYDFILQNTEESEQVRDCNKANIYSYHCRIRKYCKKLVILNYIFLSFSLLFWCILTFPLNESGNFWVYFQPIWWHIQIYSNLCLGYTVFLVVLLILYFRYYALTAKIFNSFLNGNASKAVIDYLDLNRLQVIKTSQIALSGIKSEYMSLVILFQSNSVLWNVPAFFLGINQILQIINGFVFFFGTTTGNRTDRMVSSALIFGTGGFFGVIYIVSIARLNAILEQFRKIITLIHIDR